MTRIQIAGWSLLPASASLVCPQKKGTRLIPETDPPYQNGSDLLSHLGSTIGAVGLNFSVRNGKRWNPDAIAT